MYAHIHIQKNVKIVFAQQNVCHRALLLLSEDKNPVFSFQT